MKIFLKKFEDHLIKFGNCLDKYHPRIKFYFEQKKNGRLSFLDVEVSREGSRTVTIVYRTPTFRLLVAAMHILTVLYHPHINLVFRFSP